MEETVDPTGDDKNINSDAYYPPFTPPPDTNNETIIQPKIEQGVVEDVLKGDK